MIELQKIDKIYYKDYDISIKSYLSKEEIELIATKMLAYDKLTERDYIKNIMLCKIATDIPDDFNYADNYELIVNNGIISFIYAHIDNVYDIEDYVANEESVSHQVKNFLEQINVPLQNVIKEYGIKMQTLDSDKVAKYLAQKK